MKKAMCLMVVLIGMICTSGTLRAQKLDAVIDNGITNIGQGNEFNFRTFSLDVCPIRISDGPNFLGVYAQTDELYSKLESSSATGKFVSWHTGLSFNTKFGAGEDDDGWFLRTRLGFGQATTRSQLGANPYRDWQRDNNIHFSMNVGIFDKMSTWFGRHMLSVSYRQPVSGHKDLYFSDRKVSIGDSLTWNDQTLKASFTESVANFPISSNDNWLMNIDVSIGYALEHPQFIDLKKNLNYFTVGAGISFFKDPYFQQNIFEIMPEYQFLDKGRFSLKFKINLVPIIFLIWSKENIEVKLSQSQPAPNLVPVTINLPVNFNEEGRA